MSDNNSQPDRKVNLKCPVCGGTKMYGLLCADLAYIQVGNRATNSMRDYPSECGDPNGPPHLHTYCADCFAQGSDDERWWGGVMERAAMGNVYRVMNHIDIVRPERRETITRLAVGIWAKQPEGSL